MGRIYGLYGDNEEEKTHLDVLQEALMDLRRKYAMTVVFGDWVRRFFHFERLVIKKQKIWSRGGSNSDPKEDRPCSYLLHQTADDGRRGFERNNEPEPLFTARIPRE